MRHPGALAALLAAALLVTGCSEAREEAERPAAGGPEPAVEEPAAEDPARGPADGPRQILQAVQRSDRVLDLSVAACNATRLEKAVEETADEVVVTVTAYGDTGDDCAQSMSIELDDAVAERRVIDGSTGTALEVEQP